MKNVGTGFREGRVKGFKLCHDRICLISPPPKPLNHSYDPPPPHWQFIAIQFPKVPPLYSVGDDFSFLVLFKIVYPLPPKKEKPFDSSPRRLRLTDPLCTKSQGEGVFT